MIDANKHETDATNLTGIQSIPLVEDPTEEEEKEKHKKALFILLLLIIGLTLLTLLARFALPGIINMLIGDRGTPMAGFGGMIQEGTPGMSLEEVRAARQAAADAASFRIKMNARPVFEKGDGMGNLFIVNSAENALDMEAEIRMDDTGALIYRSGRMKPNTFVDEDKLQVSLPKGEYKATASIITYHPDKVDERIGQTDIGLVITVKS
ncbi:MAG: hypothetical protein LBG71_00725 [Clostridiales Family XIII bacterium]|jgi:hypothetical protein|nr:hypothetical protein [Clostridiales Family XIII bacterium]